MNKKYGLVAIHEKILPHSHPGRKKIEPKILPTAILAKKYIETIKNKNIFRIYWTKCGPSAMLTKGKVRDEGLDHAKKTKCELNVIHWLLGIICSISKSTRLRLRVCVLIQTYTITHPFLHHGMPYIMYLWHTQLNVKDSWPKDWLILFHNIMQGILPAHYNTHNNTLKYFVILTILCKVSCCHI